LKRRVGVDLTDEQHKSVPELIRLLVRAAGANANLLLNIGPRPDGTIPPAQETRLRALGAWLAANGTSIYATRGGPIPPRSWGVTTQRADTVFVHVLDWSDPALALPPLPGSVREARVLGGGPARFRESDEGIVLELPPRDSATVDRIVRLTLARRPPGG
jgi:alpha-L-fucosidase